MPPITVFCAFTRLDYLDRWFDDLASTDLKPENTNLCFIVDCNEPKIYARIMDEMNKTNFRRFLIIRNYDHRVNEVNIPIRRQRIAEIHNQGKDLIASTDGEFVLGLEDDTVFTNLSVQRLYDIARLDQVGLVSAYQAGRWHNKIIGIWEFDDVDNPQECWTVLPGQDYEQIDAAGFYCYLTRTEHYMSHDYNSETWQPWGPDVNYGLDLRRQGLINLVDWSQPVGHKQDDIIITPNSNLYSEHFWKEEVGWVRRRQEIKS